MILDIITFLILALGLFLGWRNGFVYTFLHSVGWILSLVFGFVWRKPAEDFLMEHTGLYGAIHEAVSSRIDTLGGGSSARESMVESLPGIIQGSVKSGMSSALDTFSASLGDLIFSIVCFLAVAFAVKLALWVIISIFSKKKNEEGAVAFTDGVLGLAAGLIAGLIGIFIFFAILTVLPSIDPALSEPIEKALSDSYVAKDLYDNNLIILIAKTFLP